MNGGEKLMKRIDIEEAEALLRMKNRAKSKNYKDTFEEIRLRQDMMVLVSSGEMFYSDAFLSGNDVIIIINGQDIKIPLHVFCSEQWKKNLLDCVELKNGIDKHNKEWFKKRTKKIVSKFFKRQILTGIGLLALFLKGEMPATANLICWIGISLMFLVSIERLVSGFNFIRRAKRVTKSIRRQLVEYTI
jgi:hypothetical protein